MQRQVSSWANNQFFLHTNTHLNVLCFFNLPPVVRALMTENKKQAAVCLRRSAGRDQRLLTTHSFCICAWVTLCFSILMCLSANKTVWMIFPHDWIRSGQHISKSFELAEYTVTNAHKTHCGFCDCPRLTSGTLRPVQQVQCWVFWVTANQYDTSLRKISINRTAHDSIQLKTLSQLHSEGKVLYRHQGVVSAAQRCSATVVMRLKGHFSPWASSIKWRQCYSILHWYFTRILPINFQKTVVIILLKELWLK